MAKGALMTIGYEGTDLADFVATLRAAGVEILVDVRAIAGSRRRGFSKTPLRAALEGAGIAYAHLPGLGNPKPGRDAGKAGRYGDFERIFRAHMETEPFHQDLARAADIARGAAACLMCYERDAAHCHRRFVAEALAPGLDLEPRHMKVRPAAAAEGADVDAFGPAVHGVRARVAGLSQHLFGLDDVPRDRGAEEVERSAERSRQAFTEQVGRRQAADRRCRHRLAAIGITDRADPCTQLPLGVGSNN